MRKRWAIAFATAMLASVAAFGVQGAANADTVTAESDLGAQGWPTGCSTGPLNNGGYATCSASNGGHYRVVIICEDWFGQKVNRAPEWTTSGYSVVFCPPLTDRIAIGLESRAY